MNNSGSGVIRRKTVKKGFQFTIMVVGASGLGKSTFVNTLFETTVISKRPVAKSDKVNVNPTIAITPYTLDLDEDGVKVNLTLVDTPGFGDALDNSDNFSLILDYLENQFDEVLAEESRIKRNPKFIDNRVHVLLYFIPPSGHGLRELDVLAMKTLGKRVNIIPVISKADGFNPTELQEFKRKIMFDIDGLDIPVFKFPYDPEEDEESVIQENTTLSNMLPFAVVGVDQEIVENGRRKKGRSYPWGFVDVENPKHCDFSALKGVLLQSHIRDLKDITQDILYENYRTEKLSEASGVEDPDNVRDEPKDEQSLDEQLDLKRKELQSKQQALKALESRMAPNDSDRN